MPSQETASEAVEQAPAPKKKAAKKKPEQVKVQVHRAIGVPASPETIERMRQRAEKREIAFDPNGLTEMVYPNKDTYDQDNKKVVKADPVYTMLDIDVARKLQAAGAVSVVI